MAGGLYHWSSILGAKDGAGRPPGSTWAVLFCHGRGHVGTYQLFITFIGPCSELIRRVGALHSSDWRVTHYGFPGFIQPFRYSDNSILTDFSGYLIFAVAAVLTIAMFVAGADA